MATTPEYVKYIAEQLREAGPVHYKKLFGEYGLWCEETFFGTVEDNQFYVKMTKAGKALMPEAEAVAPHGGTPGMYLVEELDDRAFLKELVERTCEELQKPKKNKGSGKIPDKSKGEKLDYKKAYKELYLPKKKPTIIEVPKMTFLMIDGRGNPNTSKAYQQALEILYGLSFTIKMSRMSGQQPAGYFDYVVPPLEGLWSAEDVLFDGKNEGVDKDNYVWTSMIRQPEFVTKEVFEWAKAELKKKKPELDLSVVRLEQYKEGLCCQMMHVGPYDEEPDSIKQMQAFIYAEGYKEALSEERRHHEIYLGDPRRTKPENLKTVLRHPVRKKNRCRHIKMK